ncbi:MAG: DUF4239 domain-containing protein [Bacillota bacterium]
MTDFFYRLPIWASAILVLGVSVAIGLGSSVGLRRIFRLRTTAEEREVGTNLMQVVAAYIGIMIAFAGVQVWQDFADAQEAVFRESATAAELYRDLTAYGPETLAARSALRAYVDSVLDDEWPLLEKGRKSSVTEARLADLFAQFAKIRPQDNRDSAMYSEAFSKLNDLVGLRRERLIDSRSGIPGILWAVALVGSLLTVAYASAFSSTRYNVAMTAGVSLSLGMMLLFILVVDKPFRGDFSVSNEELSQLPQAFDALDRHFSAAPSR